ncbi:MAG: Wadjet anti-phage system protein JetD domain-containing protein [Gammaproteobacteria bacterium]
MTAWTTPEEIRGHVLRVWDRGRLLGGLVKREVLFPLRIPFKAPSSIELRDSFAEVQRWSAMLRAAAKDAGRPGFRLEMRNVDHRVIGNNDVPVGVWIDSLDDALALIGKRRETAHFQDLLAGAERVCPVLGPWLAKRPLRALQYAGQWSRLLDVVQWLQAHPRPGIYLRQVDIPGIHSKFIEQHKGVLAELLDLALPADAIDRGASGTGGFERRYGFRAKPMTIRLRWLDPAKAVSPGLTDISLIQNEFAWLDPDVQRVFITENEINFLAFPDVADSLVIFGAGYGFDALEQARWLRDKILRYWGDIDTHGFAILDQLRARFPDAGSFLMDRDTLQAHRDHWTEEKMPTGRDLRRLTAGEWTLYDDIRSDRLGHAVRLEQERIGFRWLQDVLKVS